MRRRLLALVAGALLLLWCAAAQATVTRQIANAPGWQPSTSYTGAGNLTSSRVLAGPGYAAGAFTNGSAVYLWIATVSGTSASSGNGPTISGSCAGSTAITDGGVTWKCLATVDYNSITGYLFDDAAWVASNAYTFNSFAVSDQASGVPKVYRLINTETSGCTSGSNSANAPTGTGGSINDNGGTGGCTWEFIADLNYSSQAGAIPKQTWASAGHQQIQMADYYVGNIWYGGIGRPEYVPGSNGESNPIITLAHADLTNDDTSTEGTPLCQNISYTWPNCGGTGATQYYTITLQAQPTDSFINNPSAASNPLVYNSANGVSIHATAASSNTGISSTWLGGSAHQSVDGQIVFDGLQIKADHGNGMAGSPHGNLITIENCIIDGTDWSSGATTPYSVWVDGSSAIINSVIIYRGATAGGIGLVMKYPAMLINDTIVNLGSATDSVGIEQQEDHTLTSLLAPVWRNVAVFGFVHMAAAVSGNVTTLGAAITSTTQTSLTMANSAIALPAYIVIDGEIMKITAGWGSTALTVTRAQFGTTAATHLNGAVVAATFDQTSTSHNATDLAAVSAPTSFTSNGATFGAVNLPGVGSSCGAGHASTCYGLTEANQFVSDTADFRLKAGADLIGAGITVSATNFDWNSALTNAADIIGQARPNGSSYDIGAWEYYAGAAAGACSRSLLGVGC